MAQRGFLLGKFLPPHRGHEYLIRFARAWMAPDPLTVLVCSIASEPIPGAQRVAWVREMVPDVDVRHCADELPQAPEEHVDFWPLWRRAILDRIPAPPSHVFASEPYGARLAAELGAAFVPVDIAREMAPVSGTAVRSDPLAHWAMLPEPVRPHFLKRVAVVGPESSGKTTLARRLGDTFATAWVHEWARPFYDFKGSVERADMPLIARGQEAAIAARERVAQRVLISDTDALTTCVWSELLFGAVDPEVEAIASRQRFDLTLVMPPDAPWVDDGTRLMPDLALRQRFDRRLRERLAEAGRVTQMLAGSWAEKEAIAHAAIVRLLAPGR
ncbi:MAG TPA: AAA family ATPase [Planctomycetota bacterium]|nr:AAA family ATPase [Planctomycetota bacterium]